MKQLFSFCMALLLVVPFGCSQPNAPATSTPAPISEAILGDWKGTLSVQGQELPIVFHFKAEDDALKGTMDSPKQGAFGLPCSQVQFDANELVVEMGSMGIAYKGTLKEGVIDGTFQQNGMELPLTLRPDADASASAPKRPQTPQAPFDYNIKEVTFRNASANINLAGTLTIPADCQQCPAVVLVSGSGPQDRDETLMGHKPFWVIADHLTRHGIAVLRFDDRGVGASEGDFKSATSADFMTDAVAAVAFLKGQVALDPAKIGVLGHSEGGLIAPMVAAETADLGFIVSLAGPGMAGKDLLPDQVRLITAASGASEEETAQAYAQSKKACTLIAESTDEAQLRQALTPILEEQGLSGTVLENTLNQYTTPWFRYFMQCDPVVYWKQVQCPVLALNGAKDLQVPADDNLAGIVNALKAGNNPPVTTKKMEGLNHLFQQSETGAPSEYATIEETFSEEALMLIINWINQL